MGLISVDSDFDAQGWDLQEIIRQPHKAYSIVHVGKHVRKAFRDLRVNFNRMSHSDRDAWNKLSAGQKDEWKERGRWSRLNRHTDAVLIKPQKFLDKADWISGYASFIQAVAVLAYYAKLVGTATAQTVEYPSPHTFTTSYDPATKNFVFHHIYGIDVSAHPQYFFNAFQVHPDIKPPMNGFRLTRWLGQRFTWPPPPDPEQTTSLTDRWKPRWPLTRPGKHIVVYNIYDGAAFSTVHQHTVSI